MLTHCKVLASAAFVGLTTLFPAQAFARLCSTIYSNQTAHEVDFKVFTGDGQPTDLTIQPYSAFSVTLHLTAESCENATVKVLHDYLFEPGFQRAVNTHYIAKTLIFVDWYEGGFSGSGEPIGTYVRY